MNRHRTSRNQNFQRVQQLSTLLAVTARILATVLPIAVAIARATADASALAQRAHLFPSDAVCSLQRFAGWTGASVAASMFSGGAISIVLTLGNPQAQRAISFGMGATEIVLLFFAVLVWLMAAILIQGQLLAEENAAIV